MNKFLMAAAATLLGAMLFFPADAGAKRLGGARPVGTQRNVTAPPAQQQTVAAPKAPQAAPAPAGSRWAGILGGLALGGLLGYLFGGSGMLGVLLLAGLALLAVVAVRAFMHSRAAQPVPIAATGNADIPLRDTPVASIAPQPMSAEARFPTGFDAEGFLSGAKVNFVKLQLANDRGDLEEIREFTTPELFEALQAEVQARASRQETDITALEARLLDLATENGHYWASVGFSGLEREAPGASPASFSEVWNLVKPVDGASGWLLAGIQQMH